MVLLAWREVLAWREDPADKLRGTCQFKILGATEPSYLRSALKELRKLLPAHAE